MSENNQKMEPPVPHMTVKEQKKLAQLQKTNNMKDNYTYAFQTMKAACPDSVYGFVLFILNIRVLFHIFVYIY
jgi:hypothetical protein